MNLPNYATLKTEMAEPHVLVVTLNRPAAANALNTQMGRDFLDLWTRLTEGAGEVRCVVLTGAGDKVFCAGGDLKERHGMTREQWVRQHEIFERQYWALIDLCLPVIAAVNAIEKGRPSTFSAAAKVRGRLENKAKLEKEFKAALDEAVRLNPQGKLARDLLERYSKEGF